jgi:hypothetical protein
MERYAEPMPGENFHALTDPDEEDAARGEELEFNHTRYAGWDEAS